MLNIFYVNHEEPSEYKEEPAKDDEKVRGSQLMSIFFILALIVGPCHQ